MARKSLISFLTNVDFPTDRDVGYLRSELSTIDGYNKAVSDLRHPSIKLFVRGYSASQTLLPRQIHFEDFSVGNAIQSMALGGFLSVNVQQYMFCRHRVKLVYPYLPLVAAKTLSGHIEYYALELLDIEFTAPKKNVEMDDD